MYKKSKVLTVSILCQFLLQNNYENKEWYQKAFDFISNLFKKAFKK